MLALSERTPTAVQTVWLEVSELANRVNLITVIRSPLDNSNYIPYMC